MKINYKINRKIDEEGYYVGQKIITRRSTPKVVHTIISIKGDDHWKAKWSKSIVSGGVMVDVDSTGGIFEHSGDDGKGGRGYFVKYEDIIEIVN